MSKRLARLMLLAAVLAACADAPAGKANTDDDGALADTSGAPGAIDPALRIMLDSARMAFEGGDAARSLTLYRSASERDSTLAAAWFGVFMAERALGNSAAADSAFRRSRRLAEMQPGRPAATGR